MEGGGRWGDVAIFRIFERMKEVCVLGGEGGGTGCLFITPFESPPNHIFQEVRAQLFSLPYKKLMPTFPNLSARGYKLVENTNNLKEICS